jgi:hypothetical protein
VERVAFHDGGQTEEEQEVRRFEDELIRRNLSFLVSPNRHNVISDITRQERRHQSYVDQEEGSGSAQPFGHLTLAAMYFHMERWAK